MSTLSSAGVVSLGATTRGGLPAPRRRSRAHVAARTVNAVRAGGDPSPSAVWPHRGANSGHRRVARRGDAVVRRGFLDRLFGGDKKETGDGNGDETPATKPVAAPDTEPEPPAATPPPVLGASAEKSGRQRLVETMMRGVTAGAEEPFYVIDLEAAKERLALWRSLLPNVEPHYAAKCNGEGCCARTEKQTVASIYVVGRSGI